MCRTGDAHHGKTADVSLTAGATERFTQRSLDSQPSADRADSGSVDARRVSD